MRLLTVVEKFTARRVPDDGEWTFDVGELLRDSAEGVDGNTTFCYKPGSLEPGANRKYVCNTEFLKGKTTELVAE
jgi:hypothetical protein